MHGQELADEIGKRKGEKPSPGTIYPALKGLKESGFIKEYKEDIDKESQGVGERIKELEKE